MTLKTLAFLCILAMLCLPWQPAQAKDNTTLTVFAAASLTDAFEDIASAFEAEYPDITVIFNFAGSSTLAHQLAEGAPVDIFASANPRQMRVAQDAGRIAGSPITFAHNRLVVIVPADNPADIQSLHDLANDGVLLVVTAPEVPVRAYTDTMLERLAAADDYGAEYRDAVVDNIVSEEPDVRQVAAKVAFGEADAGVVYLSDVTPDIAEDVITIDIPDAYNTLATYPIALTDDTVQPEQAQLFIDFVLSDAGQEILVHWGFVSVRNPEPEGTPTPCPAES